MSDSIRERLHELPTVLETNVNGRETKLSVRKRIKSPICSEILFSVQPYPMLATELNLNSMITLLDTNETDETSQVIEVRAWLEKKLKSCSAKTLFDLTPTKNFDYAFEIGF